MKFVDIYEVFWLMFLVDVLIFYFLFHKVMLMISGRAVMEYISYSELLIIHLICILQETEIANETLIQNKNSRKPSVQHTTIDVVPASNHKSKKKKKKKSKESSTSSIDRVERSLDAALDNLSLDTNCSSHQPGPIIVKLQNAKAHDNFVKQQSVSLLQVDSRYLNAENELRRIFGSKVVKSFERTHQSGNSRQVRGGRRGSHHVRKTILVSPSEQWPRWDGSLSMELLEPKDGYSYFR